MDNNKTTKTKPNTNTDTEEVNVVDTSTTDTGKVRKVKSHATNVSGIAITSPPSMVVLAYYENGEPQGQIELAPGHKSLDRMDLLLRTSDGTIAAVKGDEATQAGELPMPPPTPSGCHAIGNVYVKAGTTGLDEFSINPPVMGGTYELDPRDEFEALLIEIVDLQRRKRADYANDANPYTNFDINAAQMNLPDYTPLEDCKSMVLRKIGRINNLRGRDPRNETVEDSYRDLCVYAILMYGLHLRDGQ